MEIVVLFLYASSCKISWSTLCNLLVSVSETSLCCPICRLAGKAEKRSCQRLEVDTSFSEFGAYSPRLSDVYRLKRGLYYSYFTVDMDQLEVVRFPSIWRHTPCKYFTVDTDQLEVDIPNAIIL